MIFSTSRYQGIVKATVSGVFEDLNFKISEGSDQNLRCPQSALSKCKGQRKAAHNLSGFEVYIFTVL